jgi:uncharacterized protein YaaN involved in tellurite resistance
MKKPSKEKLVRIENVSLIDKKTVSDSSFNRLNDAQKKQALEIAKKVDFNDNTTIANFGIETQQKLGAGLDNVLEMQPTSKLDSVGLTLSEFVGKMKEVDYQPSALERIGMKIPFIKDMIISSKRNTIEKQNIKESINSVSVVLEKHKVDIIKGNGTLNKMKQENLQYMVENEINVSAVELVLHDLKENLIPAKEEEVRNDPSNYFLLDELNSLKAKVRTFDKKHHNMKMSTTISFQTVTMIDMMIASNDDLVEQIQNAHTHVLPVWKQQGVQALMLDRQKQDAQMMRMFNDTTNKMIVANSNMFKENSLLIAKESERSDVDIETVRTTVQNILDTIEGVKNIREENVKQMRLDAKELEQLNKNLNDGMRKLAVGSVNSDATIDVNFEEVRDNKMIG